MEEIKELMLQEKLSVQRTILANQTTFLAFLRTALYFLVAGLSIRNLLGLKEDNIIHLSFYAISGIIMVFGLINYARQSRKIKISRQRIRECKTEYQSEVSSR